MARQMIKDNHLNYMINGMLGAMRREHSQFVVGGAWEVGGMPCWAYVLCNPQDTHLPGLWYMSGVFKVEGCKWVNITACKNYILGELNVQRQIIMIDCQVWDEQTIRFWFRYW